MKPGYCWLRILNSKTNFDAPAMRIAPSAIKGTFAVIWPARTIIAVWASRPFRGQATAARATAVVIAGWSRRLAVAERLQWIMIVGKIDLLLEQRPRGCRRCRLRKVQNLCAFYDRDESEFYGECVEEFLLRKDDPPMRGGGRVVELGVGSGKALCDVLHRIDYPGVIDGYELDPESCRVAARMVEEHGLTSRYRITNADFFEATLNLPDPVLAIANPPYLPLRQGSSSYPVLSGGPNGNAVTDRIINSGFRAVMVMLSSFSDPLHSIELAAERGYSLVRWIARPLQMGPYSGRAPVRHRINELAADGKAFIRGDSYLLVGVTWRRDGHLLQDASGDLAAALHSFPMSDGGRSNAMYIRGAHPRAGDTGQG
jgi:hypothetical protein